MVRRQRTKNELRCLCSRQPLLAVYGIDEQGRLYVHQKVYKQGRVFGESLFYGGIVKLLCRECLRWNEVVFRESGVPALAISEPPNVLIGESSGVDSLHPPDTHS